MLLSDRGGPELRDYLSVLRRRKWVIALWVTVVVGSALFLSFLQDPVYESKARLLIERDRSLFTSNEASSSDASFLDTQMQVIESQPVKDLVKEKLGSAPPVSTSVVGTTSVVEIRAESEDPHHAADIANAYVDAYLGFRRKQATDMLAAASREVQGKVDNLQRQIDALAGQLASLPPCTQNPPSASCTQRDALQRDRDSLISQQRPFREKLDQLQVDSSLGTTSAQIVTPGAPSEDPVRPTPIRNGLLALAVGLVCGTALAFLFEYLDDSIKGKDDLERIVGDVAVLAMIPSVSGWRDRDKTRLVSLSEPASPSAEAYRTLRTSVRFLAVDRPLRTIQVTSPSAGEGKTTTTANLGVALARAGERVVVVSCDLRRPRLHEFFGLSNNVGFTSVLLGEAPLSAALQRVNPNDDRLWLLASGPLPPNPSELLSSARATEVLTGLEGYADTILIDCPPVLPVTDAAVLSAKVDGTLIVVTAGSTTSKQLTRTVEILRQVGAPLVGVVLNNAASEATYGYSYAYYSAESGLGRSAVRDATSGPGNGQSGSAEGGAAKARQPTT